LKCACCTIYTRSTYNRMRVSRCVAQRGPGGFIRSIWKLGDLASGSFFFENKFFSLVEESSERSAPFKHKKDAAVSRPELLRSVHPQVARFAACGDVCGGPHFRDHGSELGARERAIVRDRGRARALAGARRRQHCCRRRPCGAGQRRKSRDSRHGARARQRGASPQQRRAARQGELRGSAASRAARGGSWPFSRHWGNPPAARRRPWTRTFCSRQLVRCAARRRPRRSPSARVSAARWVAFAQ